MREGRGGVYLELDARAVLPVFVSALTAFARSLDSPRTRSLTRPTHSRAADMRSVVGRDSGLASPYTRRCDRAAPRTRLTGSPNSASITRPSKLNVHSAP